MPARRRPRYRRVRPGTPGRPARCLTQAHMRRATGNDPWAGRGWRPTPRPDAVANGPVPPRPSPKSPRADGPTRQQRRAAEREAAKRPAVAEDGDE